LLRRGALRLLVEHDLTQPRQSFVPAPTPRTTLALSAVVVALGVLYAFSV
jgi:hypothetical protein